MEEVRSASAPVDPKNPGRGRGGGAGRERTPSRSRSRSQTRASSAPLLTSQLRRHNYDVTPNLSPAHHLPAFETKHAGPAALRRIFLGPHVLPSKRKSKHQAEEDTGSESDSLAGSSESEGEEVDGDGNVETREERLARKMSRQRQRISRRVKQLRGASGATFGTTITSISAEGKTNMQKWSGGSFEIGGDIKDAAQRRLDSRKRKVSGGGAATTVTTAGGASRAATKWFDARDDLRGATVSMAGMANGDYSLAEPPKHIEAAFPALTHQLLRRNSDFPPLDNGHGPGSQLDLSVPGGHAPTSLFLSAVSSPPHHTLKPKGSKLGWGFPLSNSPKPLSLAEIPTPKPPEPIRQATAFTLPLTLSPPPPKATSTVSGAGDLPPVPVDEVLARTVDETGELAPGLDPTVGTTPEARRAVNFPSSTRNNQRLGKDDILRTERMLCRAEWTEREDLPDSYDEQSSRKFTTFKSPWEEFAVVWRPKRVELWTEYPISSTAYFTGHKRLKHTIPLIPSRTKLSLYSSPDLIFCLTHRPTPSHRFTSAGSSGGVNEPLSDEKSKKNLKDYVHFRHEGTHIYILRAKNSDVAKEWMWGIFKTLGGKGPEFLEISVPGLGAKIRLRIPDDDYLLRGRPSARGVEGANEGYSLVTPAKVVEACVEQLSLVDDWKDVVQTCKEERVDLQLAWRRGPVLDWVKKDGKEEWTVLGGWVLRQPYFDTVLELRPALHYPTTARFPATATSPRRRISEPPAVEGYLTRIKRAGGTENIYLSSHDGHLFICRPSTAFPPDPPLPVYESLNNPAALVLAPFVLGFASLGVNKKKKAKVWERLTGTKKKEGKEQSKEDRAMKVIEHDDDDGEKGDSVLEEWEKGEQKRIWKQIMAARGFVDLRDVVSIERVRKMEGPPDLNEVLNRELDAGGQPGLDAANDKDALRRQRSFIVTTKGGQEINFECYSTDVASEWIGRLNALRTYWARREREDVLEQMELQSTTSTSATRTTSVKAHQDHPHVDVPISADDDFEASSPLLAKIYNHCILEGCRHIMASGRLYIKRGLRGTFRERYLFLLPGTLLEYQTRKRDIHGQPNPHIIYHQRKNAMSLRGCFVYCGRLAAALLNPNATSSWDPADSHPQFPRIYETDGLTSTDEDEDCTLVIFKKRAENRGLGRQGTVTVLRARSMLERDEWVFALNAAIEKLQKSEKEREDHLKDFSWLPKPI